MLSCTKQQKNGCEIVNRQYDLIVPIGAACSCTSTLRIKNLQYFSYPFDWLFGAGFLNRVRILTNNFENWLNIEDLEIVGTRQYPRHSNIYLNKKTDITYNHDFMTDTPLDIEFPLVKEKYDRRINRVINQIENSDNVLFVYIERPDIRKDLSDEELKEGYELLKNRFPNVDINILYTFSIPDVNYKERKILNISEHIIRIDLDYDEHNKEYPFNVDIKKVIKVFKNISISDKFLNSKQKLYRKIDKLPNFIIKLERYEDYIRVILFNLISFRIHTK